MSRKNATERQPDRQPVRESSYTLRLTFAYDGSEVRLIRSQRVAMITPPSTTSRPEEGDSGHWIEVQDAKDNVLYHRVVHDPMPTDVEVFSDDPAQSITRLPKSDFRGEFTLLVPDLPEASTFVFRGTPLAIKERSVKERNAKAQFTPAEELLRYSFEELRRFQEGRQDGGEVSS